MTKDYCDGCIYNKYESDTNATYCKKDLPEPTEECPHFDDGVYDVDGDAERDERIAMQLTEADFK